MFCQESRDYFFGDSDAGGFWKGYPLPYPTARDRRPKNIWLWPSNFRRQQRAFAQLSKRQWRQEKNKECLLSKTRHRLPCWARSLQLSPTKCCELKNLFETECGKSGEICMRWGSLYTGSVTKRGYSTAIRQHYCCIEHLKHSLVSRTRCVKPKIQDI